MQRIFGTSYPALTATWNFTATNVTTGQPMPVRVNQTAAPTEVHVEVTDKVLPTAVANVTFPTEAPPDTVWEVRATAMIRDTLGNTAQVERRLGSHILPVHSTQDIDNLLAAIADLTTVSRRLLLFASQVKNLPSPDIDPTITDASLRRGRLVRLAAMHAAWDQSITIDELAELVRAAKLFGGQVQAIAP
jgi:hypothetical protein